MDYNRWTAIGKVEDKPPISDANGRKQVAFNFVVNDRRDDGNGKYVDFPIKVPVYAFDKKAELVDQYVVDGQELTIDAKYINWEANGAMQHGFVILSVVFGFKPKGYGGGNQGGANNTSGGPPV